MKVFSAVVALVCLAVSVMGEPEILTTDNIQSSIENGDTWFVKFYAPWCGHCKRLAPTWSKLADEFGGDEKVHVAKVDCTTQRAACDSHSVRGYPTLKLFTGGSSSGTKYSGQRDLSSLASFIRSNTDDEEL